MFADEQMVAGGMTFYFAQANVLHTQYLAADLSIRSYSPAAYLYYRMLCLAAGMGCNALSWGISTGGTRQGAELRSCGEQGRVRELPCREPRLYKNL